MSAGGLPHVRAWYRRVPARVSPLRLFEALYADEPWAFLYESLEAHGGRGRYSFIGGRPRAVFRAERGAALLTLADGRVERPAGRPLDVLRRLVQLQEDAPPVAPFCGGAVGYLGYDTVRWYEDIADGRSDPFETPDALFMFPQEVICFDHHHLVLHVLLYRESGQEERYREILDALALADRPDPATDPRPAPAESVLPELPPLRSNLTRAEFEAMVLRAKEYIYAGDIFQVVLSQRFELDIPTPPLRVYEALRITNPSPYMYFLRLGDLHIVGSSPELLVTQVGRRLVTRPLAGTRRRGQTPEEDRALAEELRNDPKERAEHVMLVDLGRNDLGRVCEPGSIELSDVLSIERHSKVMHLVSNVAGWRRAELDAFDVFGAVFPAGTLSGAPKVRAMQVIEELEPTRRGIYGGAIGYFSVLGDLDLCIAIRTLVIRGNRGYVQAGAGIVADSVPAAEYEETVNKARGVLRAVQLAQLQG